MNDNVKKGNEIYLLSSTIMQDKIKSTEMLQLIKLLF